MGFRYRKRWNLLPGLAINLSKKGLSSLSFGRPGATINMPIAREGPAQGTVGLPGTGLSWRESLSDKSRSKRDRQQEQRGENGYTSTEWIITDLMDILCQPKSFGAAFWDGGLAQQTLEHPETPRQIREQALLLKSPETIELHLRRAKGVAATKRAANEVLAALSAVMSWTKEQGWWVEG